MANRSKFAFDVTKPIKFGHLRKHTEKHPGRFNVRFCVLYKGFLVYYDEGAKWQLDYSLGDTLEHRRGAIKLKGGSCRAAPTHTVCKECVSGFILHAPDPTNKRQGFLFDASDVITRDAWVEAISSAIPVTKKESPSHSAQ